MRVAIEQVPKLSQEEAFQRFQDGSAVFVDVRSEAAYRRSHIPGARSVPLRERARALFDLPRDRALVFY